METLGLQASWVLYPACNLNPHGLAHCQGTCILPLTAHPPTRWHSVPIVPPATLRNWLLPLLPSLQIRPEAWLSWWECWAAQRHHEAGSSTGLRKESSQSGQFGSRQIELLASSRPPLLFYTSGLCSCCSFPLIPVQPPPSLPVAFPFISASAHRPLCIFSILYLSLCIVCIVLFTLWLALWLFMYLIFPIIKRLREQGLYLRHIYFLQSTQNSA